MPTAADADRIAAWRAARRLLVVRLDNLGDLLMTTPAIAALRTGSVPRHITVLTSPAGAALAPHAPDIDAVLVHEASWVANAVAADPAAEQELIADLARRRFDAAVVCTVCTQSALPAALLVRLAGVPLRLAHSRENPYALLTDWVREPDVDLGRARHEVRRQLDLVGHVGFGVADERLRFRLRPDDVQRVRLMLRRGGVSAGQPVVVVHPGASAPSRRYPAARFGRAAERIARRSGAALVFTGGPGEGGVVEAARARVGGPSLSLCGALTLGELGALLAQASLLLGNNSGPVHLAAAVGTPVVDLYALTNPQHTPWQVPARVLNHDVPCRNCLKSVCPLRHHRCLRLVPAAAVAAAALELMEAGAAAGAGASPQRGPRTR
jgi:lipopolysaccharide heptosyltransferase II